MYQETKEEFKERIKEANCEDCVFGDGENCYYNPETVECPGWCAHYVRGDYKDPV